MQSYVTDKLALYNGDSCELIKQMPDNSLDLQIFSPPFANLYVYSDNLADMGNCADSEEFFEQFDFLIPELFRTLRNGRICAVHCSDLPVFKFQSDYSGLYDFSGDIIKHFEKFGFKYHSRVTIWKDPVVEMQRTKAHGLLWKQLRKDSTYSRVGMPDYMLIFRKWGDDEIPVTHTKEDFPVEKWQKVASPAWDYEPSPVWWDIQQTNVLNAKIARSNMDEKHICLARGSLILTRCGFKPIEEISIGDMVLTHKGNWKPVIDKRCTGINDTIQTYAQGVANLITTPTHKLWAKSGRTRKEYAMSTQPEWIEAKDTLGGYVNLKLPEIEESNLTSQEWWIVGRYLADGHVSTRGNDFFISVGKDKVAEFEEKANGMIGFSQSATAIQYRLKNMSNALKEMLVKCGKGAANKQLPVESICLNKELSESLLSGYLSGDGCKTGNEVSASSVSRALLLGMAMVVQRARNVIPSLHLGKKAGTRNICGRTVNQLDCWVLSWRENTHHRFGEILDDGAWKKVRKIENKEQQETWSIQVADDSSYTAEGCIVKNCPLQLDVIERIVELYSNPGDTVFTPFMGIGSEVYQAVKMGRKGVGIELKPEYFEIAVENCKDATDDSQTTLFD